MYPPFESDLDGWLDYCRKTQNEELEASVEVMKDWMYPTVTAANVISRGELRDAVRKLEAEIVKDEDETISAPSD